MNLQDRLAALQTAYETTETRDELIGQRIVLIHALLADSNLASPSENAEIEALEGSLGITPQADSVIWGD